MQCKRREKNKNKIPPTVPSALLPEAHRFPKTSLDSIKNEIGVPDVADVMSGPLGVVSKSRAFLNYLFNK